MTFYQLCCMWSKSCIKVTRNEAICILQVSSSPSPVRHALKFSAMECHRGTYLIFRRALGKGISVSNSGEGGDSGFLQVPVLSCCMRQTWECSQIGLTHECYLHTLHGSNALNWPPVMHIVTSIDFMTEVTWRAFNFLSFQRFSSSEADLHLIHRNSGFVQSMRPCTVEQNLPAKVLLLVKV